MKHKKMYSAHGDQKRPHCSTDRNAEHEHAQTSLSAHTKYFCSMCADVHSDSPGSCPKCGMTLERNPAWTEPSGKVIYTCPMHPQIQQERPGTCPICGMTLESRTGTAEHKEESAEAKDLTRKVLDCDDVKPACPRACHGSHRSRV
jgi:P-type Cu+ transporter